MYAIGIDIGTTSICGIVIDAESGKVIESRTKISNAFLCAPYPWEKIQDTHKIISLATEILESFEKYHASAIGITGQMHGIVYVDKCGKAISPLYTWQDARGNLSYKGSTYAKYLDSPSGYGNVTDFYNRINSIRPHTAVSYCTIMDYLAMVLCGLKTPRIHITNAASLGCFSLSENKFVCEKNPITFAWEGEIANGYQLAGFYKGIPVSVAIGDNQASVFSTLSNEENLLINVGTGSQVSIISDRIRTETAIETRPYFDGKYLIVGAALCGGRSYGLLKAFYESFLQAAGVDNVDVYEVMNRLLLSSADQSLTVDTRFAGTRKDSDISGSITGITVDNFTPANLCNGFLRGMAKELYDMYQQMGEAKCDVIGSGNGIRKNKILAKIMQEQFGGNLRIPLHTEEASYGAALFALISCGFYVDAKRAQALIQYESYNI